MTLSPSFPRRRFTGDEVMRMVDLRILHESDPFELLGGDLIAMTPQRPAHATLVEEQRDQLRHYALVTLVEPGDTLTPPGTSALWALDALLP